MTVAADDALSLAQGMLGDLKRLVEAIDLRAPRPERPGEARIAHDAAELRARAVVLIHCIESTTLRSARGPEETTDG
jgi:hypothetical protein